jgi:hypothetical protein
MRYCSARSSLFVCCGAKAIALWFSRLLWFNLPTSRIGLLQLKAMSGSQWATVDRKGINMPDMENEARVEKFQMVVGPIVIAAVVVAAIIYGQMGSDAGKVVILVILGLSPVVFWFFRRRARRAVLRAVAEYLKQSLTNARTKAAAERESSDQVWMAPAREGERARLLGLFEASLAEARRTANLKAREEKLDRALEAYIQYLVCVQLQKVEDMDGAAQRALAANDDGRGSYPVDALNRMRELTSSIRRDLEATKPRPHGFVEPGDKVLQRTREPLGEAAALAKGMGLLAGSPALEPTTEKADEESLLSMGTLLQATRRVDDD